jgi:hypothetical protein
MHAPGDDVAFVQREDHFGDSLCKPLSLRVW